MNADMATNFVQVLIHWACAKISASSDVQDTALCDLLTRKLGGSRVSYTAIAAHAQVCRG